MTGPAGRRWTLAGIPGADAASHRSEWPGQCGQPVPRPQAGLAGRRSAGLATRARGRRCRPGSRGRGWSDTGDGPGSPDACPRRPEPPHSAAGRPARPPGTRPQSVAAAPLRAGHRQAPRSPGSEQAPKRKLHTRIGVGIRVSGAGIRLSEDEDDQGSARPAPRWPPRRPAATSQPRPHHAPPRPSAGLRRAAAHPPRIGPGAGVLRPHLPARQGSKLSTSQRQWYWAPVGWQVTCRFSS